MRGRPDDRRAIAAWLERHEVTRLPAGPALGISHYERLLDHSSPRPSAPEWARGQARRCRRLQRWRKLQS